ncbi:MAG: ABC transporter ATP-binding protein [Longimicrobiales bacterium]
MSSDRLAVAVRGLGKSYRIRHDMERGRSMRESLMRRVRHPFGAQDVETFWALRDVSFDVRRGEILGIIGRNGAGKSTLLKILSRITYPTAGTVDLYGRTGSLLEVGTGFHRELTGRENVYLNGGILGMTRAEIDANFDEIVAFAGTERFLDTPVKRYSSGMYVRLAFAVAAHLRPDVLIVDEVLSVGDANFQKKCIGKMGDVASTGRTVIFVSHNMGAVVSLCERVVLLADGRVVADGEPESVVARYLELNDEAGDASAAERTFADDAAKPAQIQRIALENAAGETAMDHDIHEPLTVTIDYVAREPLENLLVTLQVRSTRDEILMVSTDADADNFQAERQVRLFPRDAGSYRARITLPAPLWNVGAYDVVAELIRPRVAVLDSRRGPRFRITEVNSFTSSVFHNPRRGHLAVPLRWETYRNELEPYV